GRAGQRWRDTEVVLDANMQPELRRVVHVPEERVVVLEVVPGVVMAHAVRADGDALRAVLKGDPSIGTAAVDVVVEERHCSGCPAQAASTIVQRTPETRVWPPRSMGKPASRAAIVNSR